MQKVRKPAIEKWQLHLKNGNLYAKSGKFPEKVATLK